MTTEVEDQQLVPPTWTELESNLPLQKAAKIAGPSPDGLRRHYPEYIQRVGEKRDFMKLKHALGIASGEIKPKTLRT
jgi:hypothetical protein